MASPPPPQIAPPISAGELEEQLPASPETIASAQVGSPPEIVPASGPVAGRARAEPIELAYPSRRTLARWLLVLLALYAVGWLLWNAQPAMTPFIVGLVLAFLMLPLVNRFDRFLPRPFAILTVYAGAIVLLIALADYIIPPVVDQFQQLLDSLPTMDQLQGIGSRLLQEYRDLVPPAFQEPIENGVRSALETAQSNATTYVQRAGEFILAQVVQIINTVTFLIGFLIIPIWLFYVLNDQDKGRAFIDGILHPRIRRDFWNIWDIISEVLSDYVRGQLLLGVAVGAMVGVGLLSLRLFGISVPYALLLAIVAGVTELIPIIGPVIGAIPGVLVGFFATDTPVQAGLAVLAVYVIVQQLENNFLVPRIIGESIGIHPAILMVVLIAMGQVFGLIGVVLAAPLAAVARDLFLYIYRRLEGLSADTARRSLAAEAEQNHEARTPG